ncbi:MAG: proprotein convertase P-domain-containing protein [Bacteroidota bacterium]
MFTLFKENHVNSIIPDQSELTNVIHVWREGIVKDIKVHLDITHPFVGDLMVRLTSPAGTQATLRNREGGSGDNLSAVLQGEMLQAFAGERAHGLWTLTVEDQAVRDSGTLNSWGIELDCEEFQNYHSEVFIPEVSDNNSLISTQECRFSGRVLGAEAEVEIEHPLIGDLVVSLVSPDGTEVNLHNREGGSQNHLERHFNEDHLAAFRGDNTRGTWTLKVKNFHSSDTGVVKHWKIKFRYEHVDDLKIVEGIGPKIEQLLNGAGIYSYVSLATTPAEHVKDILTGAGDRFKMHDPASWGYQASLAAQGRWDDLKTLQAELVGGKEAVA